MSDHQRSKAACLKCGIQATERALMGIHELFICEPCAGDIICAFAMVRRENSDAKPREASA